MVQWWWYSRSVVRGSGVGSVMVSSSSVGGWWFDSGPVVGGSVVVRSCWFGSAQELSAVGFFMSIGVGRCGYGGE